MVRTLFFCFFCLGKLFFGGEVDLLDQVTNILYLLNIETDIDFKFANIQRISMRYVSHIYVL